MFFSSSRSELNKFLQRQDTEKRASRGKFRCLIIPTPPSPETSKRRKNGRRGALQPEAVSTSTDLEYLRMPSDSILDGDVGEVVDDTENDSDWSAHRGEEVGWSTARNRRNRTRGRRPQADNADEDSPEQGSLALSNTTYAAIRRSTRQHQRRRQFSLAAQMEAARTLRRARRSERLRRFRSVGRGSFSNIVTRLRRRRSSAVSTTGGGTGEAGELAALNDVELVETTIPASPMERIKQQIIRSIDFVTSVGGTF